MRLRARHYRTGQLLDITCEHGKIARVEPSTATDPDIPWVAPAFCDVQINGCDALPHWLSAELALPLSLEQTYLAACTARRIETT